MAPYDLACELPREKDSKKRKLELARLLEECEVGEIEPCDLCDKATLSDELTTRTGSMRKRMKCCPTCELPDGWRIKYSKTKAGKRFYSHKDSTGRYQVQWSHPRMGNALHNACDTGAISIPYGV